MPQDFSAFCAEIEPSAKIGLRDGTAVIYFENRNGEQFAIEEPQARKALEVFKQRGAEIRELLIARGQPASRAFEYAEAPFRAVLREFFSSDDLSTFRSLGGSQTKPLLGALSKYVGFLSNNRRCASTDPLLLDTASVERALLGSSGDALYDRNAIRHAFDAVCEFCAWYDAQSEPVHIGSPEHQKLSDPIRSLETWLRDAFSRDQGFTLIVRAGMGFGKVSRVPYLVILPPGQEVSNGIYAAITFGREGAGAVAGCGISASTPDVTFPRTPRPRATRRVNVAGSSANTDYNDAFANPTEYLKGELDPEDLLSHLRESVRMATRFLGLAAAPASTGAVAGLASSRDLIQAFSRELKSCGLRFDPALTRAFVVSLFTKRFLILTGNSGSGKTQIALALARWLSGGSQSRYAVVPVGADWSDNRRVFGFINHLASISTEEGSISRYETTPILELFLNAMAEPSRPFFLVLDEMNLSHVERYFADTLSSLESGEGIPLHESGVEVRTIDGRSVPSRLPVPRNVFVVGTVNVDETTYMFSPKVLDRANVIEFRPTTEELIDLLKPTASEAAVSSIAPAGFGEAFLAASTVDDQQQRSSHEIRAIAERVLAIVVPGVHKILARAHLEFGFRSAAEMKRYVFADAAAGWDDESDAWKAIDRQVLQKVLPRLHGSRKKLEPTLAALLQFCTSLVDSSTEQDAGERRDEPSKAAKLPRSATKIAAMLESVRRDQFVSFIQ